MALDARRKFSNCPFRAKRLITCICLQVEKSFDTAGVDPAFISSLRMSEATHPEWLRDTARRRHGNRLNWQFDDQVPNPAEVSETKLGEDEESRSDFLILFSTLGKGIFVAHPCLGIIPVTLVDNEARKPSQ